MLRNLEDVAASGGLEPSRLPALFETVARNRQWWSNGPLLGNGARVSFSGSRIVWQFYAGEGLQIQWLGTFGKANGLWQGGYRRLAARAARRDAGARRPARRRDRLGVPLALRRRPAAVGQRPGAGHRAAGALARGGALRRAALLRGRPRGLGIFRAAPPSGVRVATPAGAHYLIYSFAPGLRVLNAFTQALNGLHDFAALANDAEGRALFAAGEAQLRAELAAYDTGGWSLYALGGRDANVSYHTLARDFLRGLCQRLTEDAARAAPPPVAPATPGRRGGARAGARPGGARGRARSRPVLRRRRALDAVPHAPARREARLAAGARRQAGGAQALGLQAVPRHAAPAPRQPDRHRARRAAGQRRRSTALARAAARGGRYEVLLHAQDITERESSGKATLKLLKARRAKR